MCVSYAMVAEVMAQQGAQALASADPENAMRSLLSQQPVTADEARTFPRRLAPVIIQEQTGGEASAAGSFAVEMPSWGFIVPGHSDLVFNTRIESALNGLGLWQHAIRNGRAIVWTRAFFENHGSETVADPRTGRTRKQLYRFFLEDQPLLMAALVQDGRYSVITQPAAGTVKPVHPRMPLLLDAEAAAQWLTAECDWQDIATTRFPQLAENLVASPDKKTAEQDSQQLQLF